MKKKFVKKDEVLSLLDDLFQQIEAVERYIPFQINEHRYATEQHFQEKASHISNCLYDLNKATDETSESEGYTWESKRLLLRTV
ncbi:hypothetical protein [Priestia koreensis]|uniref:hypothetical protein n=1 Tax=Priestia koreensis TaxID=284581 RepID=UPI001F55CBE6|nr:hypothetical protein [Priestia koreensis]UNL86030.1 hypothetical protein IE339_05865 [Priestia koreensis]